MAKAERKQRIRAPKPGPEPELPPNNEPEDPPAALETETPPQPPPPAAKSARPTDFWQLVRRVPAGDWGTRVQLYLYCLEPICDLRKSGEKKYLVRMDQPIYDEHSIMIDYGSGRYRLVLANRKPAADRTDAIDSFEFEIFNPKYPPKIPRSVWLEDSRNKKWAALLPPDPPPAPAAPAAPDIMSAFDTFQRITERVADRYEQQRPEVEERRPDPLNQGLEIAKQFLQMRSENPMVDVLRDELKAMREEMKAERDENRKLQGEIRQAQTPKEGTNANGFRETLKTLREELLPAIKDILPGAGEALQTVQRSRMSSWQEFALGALPHVKDLMAPLIGQMMQNQNIPGPPPPMQQLNPAAAQPGAPPPAAASQQTLMQFMSTISPAMLNWLRDGMKGSDFAEWVYDGYGAEYQGVNWLAARSTIGSANLIALYQRSPYWAQLAPIEPQFRAFVDAFIAWRPAPEPPDDGVLDLTSEVEEEEQTHV